MSEPRKTDAGRPFSFGRLALYSAGAATLVLLVAVVVLALLKPGPVVGLIIALAAVAGAIAAMGYVARRITNQAFGVADDEPAGGPAQQSSHGGK